MPILEMHEDRIDQECAKCGEVHQVALDDLTAGVKNEVLTAPPFVKLPQCSNCGAQEYLARSPDDEPDHPSPGCFGHLHRLLVDNLHAKLVEREQVTEGVEMETVKPRKKLKDELKKWFPKDFKLERQAEQEPRPDTIERDTDNRNDEHVR